MWGSTFAGYKPSVYPCLWTKLIFYLYIYSSISNMWFRTVSINPVTILTGPVKIGQVGIKYTLLLNKSYLVTGIEYFVTCIYKTRQIVNKLQKMSEPYIDGIEKLWLEMWSNFVCQHAFFAGPVTFHAKWLLYFPCFAFLWCFYAIILWRKPNKKP